MRAGGGLAFADIEGKPRCGVPRRAPNVPCPRASNCHLANTISMREALRVWQSFYCEGMYGRCERYKLAEAGSEVPARLLPNGRLLEEPVVRVAAAVARAR